MSLFKKKKNAPEPAPVQVPEPKPDAPLVTFERQYINSPSFRGYRRLWVTIFNDGFDGSEENAVALLGDAEVANCQGRVITLKGLTGPGYRGVSVYIDPEQYPLGTIWERDNNRDIFPFLYGGNITDVFLRIEPGVPRPYVYLFVKMP